MVHRPAGWQRLFVHTGFDHPIACLAWRPVLGAGKLETDFTAQEVDGVYMPVRR